MIKVNLTLTAFWGFFRFASEVYKHFLDKPQMGHNTMARKSSKLAIHVALSPFCCVSTSMNRINSLLVAEFFWTIKGQIREYDGQAERFFDVQQ